MRWTIRVLTSSAIVVCLAVLIAHGQATKPGPAQKSLEVPLQQRVAALEKEVQGLRAELAALRAQIQRSGSTPTPVASAGGGGDNFIGIWDPGKVEISKQGDYFQLDDHGAGFGKKQFKLKDGELIGSDLTGNITFNKENGHIYFFGREFARSK